MTPHVARTRAELAETLGSAPDGASGRPRRAVVMTMGALHEGHLALVRTARAHADQVVVTVFVNPLQFGPGEDLERYPRTLDADLRLLASAGADVVFAPAVDEVYQGEPVVRVSAGALGERLEGAHRPGHFDGVLTVVLKLMHLVRPDVAVFGQKDAQQLAAVRAMVHDLDVGVEVLAVPTVRDTDGVALSSRNAYLDAGERVRARALVEAIRAATAAAEAGLPAPAVLAAATGVTASADVEVDYVSLVDPSTVLAVAADHSGPALLVLAAHVGATRLIDNAVLHVTGEETR